MCVGFSLLYCKFFVYFLVIKIISKLNGISGGESKCAAYESKCAARSRSWLADLIDFLIT